MHRAARCCLQVWLSTAAVLTLVSGAGADVIFRVPEVLVRHAAASKPVGTGRANVTRVNDSETWSSDDGLLEVRYEEYFIEHDISTADARRSAGLLNLDDVPATRVGCGTCSRRELDYCETRLLADHCCCERRFLPEPFPWLPHTCYMGRSRCRPLAHDCARYARLRDCCCYKKLAERSPSPRFLPEPFPWLPHTCYMGRSRCRPLAHDCARYARLRDCCCYKKLAERWKGILSKSTRLGVSGVSLLLLSMLLFVAYL